MAGLYQGLDGVTAGSRVLIAIAPADGLGADPSTGVLDTDTLLFFAEVHDVRVPLQRAEGEAVAPVDGLPTVELAEDGAPTITVPGGEPPAALVAQPLIEGTGAGGRGRARRSRCTTRACCGPPARCSTRPGRAAPPPPSGSATAR